MIGLVYVANPNNCLHEFTILPRLWPYPVEGALTHVVMTQCS